MKIFCMGLLWEGGTALERVRTLNQLGHTMISFDTTPFDTMTPRLFRSIAYRFNAGSIPACSLITVTM